MHRIYLAFLVFFRILFGKPLPAEVLPAAPEQPQLPPPRPEAKAEAKPEATPEPKAEAKPAPAPRRVDGQPGALQLLAMLQREGRFVDFLRESVDGYTDEEIGAAARDIHRGCRKVIDEHFSFEPVVPGEENDPFTVDEKFDATLIRLVGNVEGKPPFKGQLRHHGWRVVKARLPEVGDAIDLKVVAPAEVEVA